MLLDLGARLLRSLPPEASHRATIRLTKLVGPLLPTPPPDDPRLAVEAFGLRFSNPVGLAAGFDKDGELPDAMLRLGFGFAEVGTVTPRPQSGNPQPRLFRLAEDRAVINRMGFNNAGMDAMAARLATRRKRGILGINIGANKDSADRIPDYREAFARLAPFADYVAVNVSSPNTPGLRALQNRDDLARLLGALNDERARIAKPLLLKIAPDLDQHALDDIAEIALAAKLNGIIATNTTIERPPDLRSPLARETGGLSGAPLLTRSTDVLRGLRRRVGDKLVLLGVGGIGSGAEAYAKIRAGASLVQLYTALAYEGPGVLARIKRELLTLLARDRFANVTAAVGADID
ncbi:MAG TPA: quinone-dependent dihydroorotate dehydrogenase [Rhizomicrobium sp.]|jgi:dihydroorotate dehydrogenase